MTGFGDARFQDDRLTATAEVRTVNNRYFKIVMKLSDAYAPLEGDIEKLVRETISRGTVTLSIRVDRHRSDEDFALNQVALRSYWSQLRATAKLIDASPPVDVASLLVLPGVVVDDNRRTVDLQTDGAIIQQVVRDALKKLQSFRQDEGRSMEKDLRLNCQLLATRLDEITRLAPQVVDEYRARLLERVRQLLQETASSVNDSDLIREVSIFADRTDINEEIIRLRSHFSQFDSFLDESASAGRKLEFLTQELFREVNTIGSKGNHVAIAHAVVEMKANIEKIREVLQNVE